MLHLQLCARPACQRHLSSSGLPAVGRCDSLVALTGEGCFRFQRSGLSPFQSVAGGFCVALMAASGLGCWLPGGVLLGVLFVTCESLIVIWRHADAGHAVCGLARSCPFTSECVWSCCQHFSGNALDSIQLCRNPSVRLAIVATAAGYLSLLSQILSIHNASKWKTGRYQMVCLQCTGSRLQLPPKFECHAPTPYDRLQSSVAMTDTYASTSEIKQPILSSSAPGSPPAIRSIWYFPPPRCLHC
jgi:hypothetical protein